VRGSGCLNPSHCHVEHIGLYNDVLLFNRVSNMARTRYNDFSIGVALFVRGSLCNVNAANRPDRNIYILVMSSILTSSPL
jgi:hypothetical protein